MTAGARAAAVAIALALAAGAAAYRGLYAHGAARSLAWNDETAAFPALEPTRAANAEFDTRLELEAYVRRAMPGRVRRMPRFDFGRRRLVLAAAGPRSSTGYAVRIVRVIEERRRVLVVVRETTPALGDPTAARVTYPYRLISIPAGGEPVVVEWQGRP